MELHDYLDVLRRRWVSVLIVMLATLAVAAGITLLVTPRYTATTRLFFSVDGGESVADLAQGSNYTEKQMTSYADVATSPLVLNRVIDELRLGQTPDDLAETVLATPRPNTVILDIAVTNTDPRRAALIANSIGKQLAAVAGDLSPDRPDGTQAVRATILAEAQVPTSPSSPNLLRNLGLGAALGLLLGLILALLRHLLDTKVRTEQDVRRLTNSAVLGAVPFDTGAPKHPVVMHDDSLGARSEAIRRLRTNLQFVEVGQESKSILISSSIPGEGKSTTAVNLAVSLADAGLRTLLVDADLRRPSVANYLGFEGAVGLTTVLIGRAELEDVVQPWQQTSLDVLTAGQIPPNPSELLGSNAMAALMAKMLANYDMVLVDSAPLLPVTDAAILSKIVGGTLVVVGVDHIHRAQLRDGLESLTTAGGNVVGLVLNKVARRDTSAYVYDSSYAPNAEVTLPRTLPDSAPRADETVDA